MILIISDTNWFMKKIFKIRRCTQGERERRKLPRYFLSEKRNKSVVVDVGKAMGMIFALIVIAWFRVSTMAQKTKRLIFPHAMSSRGMSYCATILHFDFRILKRHYVDGPIDISKFVTP